MGLKTDGIVGEEFEHGAAAFFDLQAGLKLALRPRASLAPSERRLVGQSDKRDAARLALTID